MNVTILPMRKIYVNACWPHSGRKYQVWEGGLCILETDEYYEAMAKAASV